MIGDYFGRHTYDVGPGFGCDGFERIRSFAQALPKVESVANLPYASPNLKFSSLRGALVNVPPDLKSFQAVMQCPIKTISKNSGGTYYVDLNCPKDAAHGDGVVCYNLSYSDGLVVGIQLQVGAVLVFTPSDGADQKTRPSSKADN